MEDLILIYFIKTFLIVQSFACINDLSTLKHFFIDFRGLMKVTLPRKKSFPKSVERSKQKE